MMAEVADIGLALRGAALVVLFGVACGTTEPPATPDASLQPARLAEVAVQVPVVAPREARDLPVGEAPPPLGTEFVDVARATTMRVAHYPPFHYELPDSPWPPAAYQRGLGMAVRWSVIHSCMDGAPAGVHHDNGVLTFRWNHGVPMHCGDALTEYETTFPPGTDAVHALRGPTGPSRPLPDVLPAAPPRRALRRSLSRVPDIFR